jgi:TolB protein
MKRAIVILVGLFTFSLTAPASATFPGSNGKLAFFLCCGLSRIVTINPDGTNRTSLTSDRRGNADPAWSADGSKIVYVRNYGDARLYTKSADGTGRTLVLDSERGRFEEPSFSPDGTQIAFTHLRAGFSGAAVFVVNVDGTGRTKISPKSSTFEIASDWSPDGSSIAITNDDSNHARVMTMDPDGSNRVVVTRGSSPSWSPDGSQIVFEGLHRGDTRYDVFVVNLDGTGRARLTETPRRWEWRPVFSPDGTEIAFSRSINKKFFSTDDIWIMNADGTSPAQITDTANKDEFGLSWQAV